ncbi:membrane protein [Mycobacterium parmense]|uniref:Membrane protein n=1 Tax=Mycobacterium parmense TaxID=185642 RepID=A0A7I7YNY7_9MYCO|nr:membrane protein [Mycobacterium parmense]
MFGQRGSIEHTTGRRAALAIAVATATAWAVVYLVVEAIRVRSGEPGYLDLQVYRAGGHALLTGNSLYAGDFAAVNHSPNGLPFTYPPIAALMFVPLALLPAPAAAVVMVVLNAVACAVLLGLVLVAVPGDWSAWRRWAAPASARAATAVLAAAIAFVVSVPVQGNFTYGQLDLILAAAVALDLVPPSVPWPRGLLVGLAAAVKLTPAVFVGYFLVTRQWRALAVSLAAAASAAALGWLADPADSVRYVTATAFDPARIGRLTFASNQSLRGVVERIPALDASRGILVVALTVGVLALAVVAIEVSRRSRDTVAAVLCAAFIGLLCSPVSWGHHWVWLSATAVYFLIRWAVAGGARNVVGGLAVALLTITPPWMLLSHNHDRERGWNGFEQLLGGAWALAALALLVCFALPRPPATARSAEPHQPGQRDRRHRRRQFDCGAQHVAVDAAEAPHAVRDQGGPTAQRERDRHRSLP